MNGNDTFLDVNNAHLRVTSGNVYASAFNLDQIDIVMSSNTASTVNFNNPTKAFNAASNIEVGTANLFVDTTTSNVGIGTNTPLDTLHVNGGVRFAGHIIPDGNSLYDIGEPENKIRDMYVDTNSLWIGDLTKIAFERGKMKFKRRKTNKVPTALVNLATSHVSELNTESEVRTDAVTFAQTIDPTISVVEDLKLEHWRDYAKKFDETKAVSDIFVDNDEDYEAVTASEAFIEVGSNIFTEHSLSIGKTTDPTATLDVAGDLNVSGNLTILGTTTTIDTDSIRVKDPIIELGKDNTASPPVVDLGLVMTRPSGSSNVGIIFDESTDTLEIGYTQGSASDSTITMESTPLSVNVNGTLKATALSVGEQSTVQTVTQNYNNLTNIPTSSRSQGNWRSHTFGNITLPANWSNDNFQFKVTVNGNLNGVANAEYVSITMKKQGSGTQPSVGLNFNPQNQSSGISSSGGRVYYTNVVVTNSTVSNGSFSAGDVVDIYMSIYSTYWYQLSLAVEIRGGGSANILLVDGTNSRVGIGLDQPTTALDVNGTVKATAFVGDGSALTGITAGQWTESGGDIYRSSGNVGIGVTNPGSVLEVSDTLTNYKIKAVTLNGVPEGGAYYGYILLAKAATGGIDSESYAMGRILARRGSSTSGHKINYYDVVSSRGYNHYETFSVNHVGNRTGNDGFTSTVKVTYNGVVYHALRTGSTGGQPTTDLAFWGASKDAALIMVDSSMVSNETSYGHIAFSAVNGNVGIGKIPDAGKKLDVNGTVKATAFEGDGSALTGISSGGQWTESSGNIYRSSGRVGIGTTSASTDLHIGNTSTKTSDTYLTIASDGGNAYAQGIRLIHHGTDTSSMYGWRIRGDDTDDCFHINRINAGSQLASAFTIKSGGSVIFGDVGGYGNAVQDAQVTIGGTHNSTTYYNTDNQVKLLITGGDNDSYSPYYIKCEDENGKDQFYLKGATSDGGTSGIVYTKGRIGVNTTSPHVPIHVVGGFGSLSSAYSIYAKSNDAAYSRQFHLQSSMGWSNLSIYASDDIVTGQYLVSHLGTLSSSDERIKENIVDVDDASALELFRLLKPKKYQYIDKIKRGDDTVFGFIAQDVEKTMPHGTRKVEQTIPNIMEIGTVTETNIITLSNFNTSDLQSNIHTLELHDKEAKPILVTIEDVIDEHSIRVDKDLSEFLYEYDENGNDITESVTITESEYNALEDVSGYIYNENAKTYTKILTNKIYVYGERIDNFLKLNKDTIWTVSTAALQEVDRQQQADKARITELESQLTAVLARLDALENA